MIVAQKTVPVRIAPVKSAFRRFTLISFPSVRSLPRRDTILRTAQFNIAPFKFALDKSASIRDTLFKSALDRFAPAKFARIRLQLLHIPVALSFSKSLGSNAPTSTNTLPINIRQRLITQSDCLCFIPLSYSCFFCLSPDPLKVVLISFLNSPRYDARAFVAVDSTDSFNCGIHDCCSSLGNQQEFFLLLHS